MEADSSSITVRERTPFQVGDTVLFKKPRHWFLRRVLAPIAGLFSRWWAYRLRYRDFYGWLVAVDEAWITVTWTELYDDPTDEQVTKCPGGPVGQWQTAGLQIQSRESDSPQARHKEPSDADTD